MPQLQDREDETQCYGNAIAFSLNEWFPKKQHQRSLEDIWQMPESCALIAYDIPDEVLSDVAEQVDTRERFLQLADTWDRETAHLSSTPRMILHDSYQKVMAMGPQVVPYLLHDLQSHRRSWFWALRHITNVNPVVPEDQGNLEKMIAAWTAWGKREGLI